jgi:hypothetical protein
VVAELTTMSAWMIRCMVIPFVIESVIGHTAMGLREIGDSTDHASRMNTGLFDSDADAESSHTQEDRNGCSMLHEIR